MWKPSELFDGLQFLLQSAASAQRRAVHIVNETPDEGFVSKCCVSVPDLHMIDFNLHLLCTPNALLNLLHKSKKRQRRGFYALTATRAPADEHTYIDVFSQFCETHAAQHKIHAKPYNTCNLSHIQTHCMTHIWGEIHPQPVFYIGKWMDKKKADPLGRTLKNSVDSRQHVHEYSIDTGEAHLSIALNPLCFN